jgi:hypothetical protein
MRREDADESFVFGMGQINFPVFFAGKAYKKTMSEALV